MGDKELDGLAAATNPATVSVRAIAMRPSAWGRGGANQLFWPRKEGKEPHGESSGNTGFRTGVRSAQAHGRVRSEQADSVPAPVFRAQGSVAATARSSWAVDKQRSADPSQQPGNDPRRVKAPAVGIDDEAATTLSDPLGTTRAGPPCSRRQACGLQNTINGESARLAGERQDRRRDTSRRPRPFARGRPLPRPPDCIPASSAAGSRGCGR
jgi:hypothetical protein